MKTFYRDILRSLLPAIIFMLVFNYYSYKMALAVGFIIGGAVYGYAYKNRGKLTAMEKVGLFGLIMQSGLGALATNPKVYFLYPLIENMVFALIFFGSLFIGREIVAIFAMDYGGAEEAYEMLRPTYRRLTAMWAVYFLIKAIVKIVGMMNWSFEILYTVNWLLGTPCVAVLMWLSFTYPNRVYNQLMSENHHMEDTSV